MYLLYLSVWRFSFIDFVSILPDDPFESFELDVFNLFRLADDVILWIVFSLNYFFYTSRIWSIDIIDSFYDPSLLEDTNLEARLSTF